jgi:putative ABC transport system permease protein
MIQSFFIAAIRNLKKNRLYSAINVLGLALGVGCCIIIFVIVRYETSFDNYHSKANRIYRVNWYQETAQGGQFNGCNYSPLAEAIRSEVTGLEAVTGVYCLYAYQFSKGGNLFEDKYAFFVDQHYFDVFDVAWIAGNQQRALTEANTAVVTVSFAEKFLGGVTNAIGNTFILENKMTLTVSGIVKTPPTNTDHPYSILISYPTLSQFLPESVDNWKKVGSGATYVVFNENTHKDQVDPQLNKIIQKHLTADVAKNTAFFLLPLNDNHDRNYAYTSFTYDFPVPVMLILSIVAGMIAFIACINFVNLATAQSLKRAKEVGIRKTMGSSRHHLIVQYMMEAFVITLLAVITGTGLAKIGMIQLNALYGGNYLQFNLLKEPSTLLFIAAITILISFLAGFYPAFVLSNYRPVLALRSQYDTGKSRGFSLRRGLIILQFAGAQILILVTIIMIHQISIFKNRSIPFDPGTIVLLHLQGNETQEYGRLHHELEQVPGIINYTFGKAGNDWCEFYSKDGEQDRHVGMLNNVDSSFIHTFHFELIAGKNLSHDETSAPSEVLVNETLIKTLGIESPEAAIGGFYTLNDHPVMIRGIIKDSYTNPMSNKVDPITWQYNSKEFATVAMNISTQNIPETLAGLEKAWKNVYPNFICKYKFMSDAMNRDYGLFDIIFIFLETTSSLAIFIGCLGLYGMVSFMAVQRTKEIGIRKVLGATVSNIMMLFTKESAILIVIAFVIAAPLGHLAGIAMLMDFPERVNPGFEIFLVTFLASLLIALLTVTYRSFSAAVQNPVDSLRNE